MVDPLVEGGVDVGGELGVALEVAALLRLLLDERVLGLLPRRDVVEVLVRGRREPLAAVAGRRLLEPLLVLHLLLHQLLVYLLSHFRGVAQALPDHVVRHPLHQGHQPRVLLSALRTQLVAAGVHVRGRRGQAAQLLARGDPLQLRVVIVSQELDVDGVPLRVEGLGQAAALGDGRDLLELVGLVARELRGLTQLLPRRVVLQHLQGVAVESLEDAGAVVELVGGQLRREHLRLMSFIISTSLTMKPY